MDTRSAKSSLILRRTELSWMCGLPPVPCSRPPTWSSTTSSRPNSQITAAAKLWDGTGGFVFTSSSGVWPDDDDVTIFTETTPTKPLGENPRTDKLLQAEQATLAAGGCVVRLAGLYHATRGAHMYFLKMGEVPSKGDSLVNLIHYKDAATLSVAALSSGFKEQTFMGCDNSPVTKIEMMEAVYASGRYEDDKCTFTITEGNPGRRMNNNATRLLLTWQPEFASFQDFMEDYKAGRVDI
ncbi:hypothetical protein CYMTET_46013 [Cymbomonas tetramitiformis]|uniref:Uncharacterized protein n=1 Tax=Cymbomonas tetramitiformis TaxID=36881 RepID=A0AAE0BY81_9CHLO|nr:hypothetical protein CYMTET_46013 [Cymbomonas tetramitiformis]